MQRGFTFLETINLIPGANARICLCRVKKLIRRTGTQAGWSQNHRMVGVGRDPCGSSVQPSCRSRVTYSRLHRTLSRNKKMFKTMEHKGPLNFTTALLGILSNHPPLCTHFCASNSQTPLCSTLLEREKNFSHGMKLQ